MALDLNEKHEYIRIDRHEIPFYKEFYGRNTEQMPLLIAAGRIPLSVAGVLERRLRSDKQDWKNNYFDTGDAIVYHPDKKFKIVLDAPPLRRLNAESKLRNRALVLEDGLYETLDGEEFL